MSVLAGMKFQRIGRHPVHGHALNAIEQINQTWTYVVALEAARVLLQMHPDPGGYKLALERMHQRRRSISRVSSQTWSALKHSPQ